MNHEHPEAAVILALNINSITMPRLAASDIIMSKQRDDRENIPVNTHPHEFLIQLLQKDGVEVIAESYDTYKFFLPSTPEQIKAYTLDAIGAVRSGDIETLRNMHAQGRTLQCCNRFGESLVHLACRRQKLDVLRFLVQDAGVSLQVCDDFGRTPLHDACWTPSPNFDLVDFIISHCPDLLFIKDRRGHSPLFYSRREHWGAWISHISKQGTSAFTPKLLSCKQSILPPNKRRRLDSEASSSTSS